MTQKVAGGTKAENIVKVTEAKALAMKVAAKLNGKPTSKPKPKMDLDGLVKRANQPKAKVKAINGKKDDRQTQRLAFIKQNSATILQAWDALKGKKSAAALNRVLPGMHNKWVDEVLMLNGLRQSGEKVVTDAVAADKPLLKDVVVARKSEPKAKVNNNLKAPVVKNGGYTDEG